MAKNDFIYKVSAEADLGDLQSELAKINSALAAARGSVSAFKAEFEKDAKGEAEYRIVVSSQYDASGSRIAKAEIKELSKEYQGLYNKIKQIESEPQKGSLTSLRQQVNEAKKVRDSIAKYGSAVDEVGNRVQALDGRWLAQNQRVKDLQKQLDIAGASNLWQRLSAEYSLKGFATAGQQISNFVNVFQSVSIIAGQVTGAINNVVNALGNLQTFSLAFEAVGAGAGAANLALSESARISSGLGTDLKTTREAFQQLSPVILKSGGSIADVSSVVETLSSRFAAYGISGDRARRVTNGVIQAFAKGKLMAEELTQQISEADPAFKTDLAGALKVTVAGLEELVKAGKVTSDVFLKGLKEIGKSDLLFGRLGTSAVDAANSLATAGTTVDQVRSKLATIGQLSLERFAKSIEPIVFSFLKLGAVVTDAFDRISRLQGIDSIGNIAGGLAEAFIRITEAILRFAEAGLAVLGIVAKFVNVLTSIPGVTDAIAIAIASKLIAPLAGLKTAFGNSISSATGFGKALRTITTFSGLNEAIKGIGQQSDSTAVRIQKLGARQEELGQKALSARADIASLQSKIEGYQKIIAGQKALPDFGVNPQSQATVERYTQKIQQNRQEIEKLGNSLLDLNADQFTTTASLDALTKKKGLAARATGALGGALKAAGGAAKGLILAIGPLGVVLAAIATLTAAYQNANKDSNSILEQSKGRIDSLKQALKATGAVTANESPRITGLALVWEKFSFVVSDVADTLGRFSNAIFGGGAASATAAKQTNSLVDQLGRLAAGAAVGAAALAGIGLAFGGIGAGVGASIGALIGGLVGLAAGSEDAAVKSRKLQESLDATQGAVVGETGAIKALVAGLNNINEKDLDVKSVRTIAGFNQAQTALKLVGKTVDGVKLQQAALNQEAAKLAPKTGEAAKVYSKLAAAQSKVAGIEKQILAERKKGNAVDFKLSNAFQAASAEAETLRQKLKELAKTDPNSKKYLELQTNLAQVNKSLAAQEAAYNSAKKELDDFARANGLLTSEQKETITTVGGLEEKLKTLQTTLQNDLNPNATPEKWGQISAEIARTTVELNSLKDAIDNSTNNELVYTIKTKINSGEIADSLANAQRLVQALEQRATVLDINAPNLYNVIGDLEAAKSASDALNGRQAEIRVTILEARGAGSTVATLSEIGRYIDALEQRKVNLSITSPDISGIIEKQNQAKLLQDAGSKSSGELRTFIQTEYYNRELGEIQRAQAAAAQASQARQAALQEEIRAVGEVTNERIRGLQAATPLERRLAELRKGELQEQAARGKTEMERVAAGAQLERLEREEEIARVQAAATAKERELQAQLREEQKAAQEEQRKFQERALEIQETLLKIAQEESDKRIEAAKSVLDARKAGGELDESLGYGAASSEVIADSLGKARVAAEAASRAILDLDGKNITVNVNYRGTPGRWAGGPTTGGQTYRINELGKEGFLSSSGTLTPINKPRNALWKAPSKGMVIPAHVMSTLSVPTGRVSTGVRPATVGSGGNGLAKIARAIQSALAQANKPDSGLQEMAAVQAHQALQIGKLSHAVNKLADKDWNVNVGVRNTGGTAYLDALNRRM